MSGALGQSLSWVQVCVITEGGLSGGSRREVRDTGLETEGADQAYDFRGNHKELGMGSLFFLLTLLGLSCGTWALQSSLQHVGSLVAASGI